MLHALTFRVHHKSIGANYGEAYTLFSGLMSLVSGIKVT